MRRSFVRSASAAWFLLAVFAASAAPPEPLAKSVWLEVTSAGSEETAELSSILRLELESALQRQDFPLLPRQEEADLAVTGFLRIQGSDTVMGVKGWEVRGGGIIFDIEQTASEGIGIYNQISSLAELMLEDLQNWAQSPAAFVAAPRRQVLPRARAAGPRPAEPPVQVRLPEQETPPGRIRVTLRSGDEGAEIYVGEGQLAGRIRAGTLTLEAQADSELSVEKRKDGYQTDREQFQLGAGPEEIPLSPLHRIARFGLELCFTSSQFLGLGAGLRWYPVPDWLMIRADAYGYFSAGSAFHQDLRLALGSYLFGPPQRRVRIGLAAGLGVVVSAFGGAAYRDLYWEVADLWAELGWNRWAVFLRTEAKYAFGSPGGLLERGFLTDYGPQYTLGWLWKW